MPFTRRQFLLRSAATLSVTGLATLGYSIGVEPHWVDFRSVTMPIRHLPTDLEGKTIMQISDIHIGHRVSTAYLMDAFQQAARLEPDLVLYTGDFVSYDDQSFSEVRKVMGQAPTGKLGTAAVLGNHDYGARWQQTEVADTLSVILEALGIRVLKNEVETFAGLKIGGIEDLWSPRFDLQQVMRQINPDDPALILCHNPDGADMPGWADYQGWILSGHTHGGQCKPPFLPPPILPVQNYRYSAGQIDLEDGRTLYINRGLGHLYRIRFNVRPEITLFKLTGQSQA